MVFDNISELVNSNAYTNSPHFEALDLADLLDEFTLAIMNLIGI